MKSTLDSRAKGLPHMPGGERPAEIGSNNWNVLAEDFPLPLAVLQSAAIDNNRRWMREFLAKTGAKIAPHGKTHIESRASPYAARGRCMGDHTGDRAAGARGASVCGIRRILLANEMVGPRDIAYVFDELRTTPRSSSIVSWTRWPASSDWPRLQPRDRSVVPCSFCSKSATPAGDAAAATSRPRWRSRVRSKRRSRI